MSHGIDLSVITHHVGTLVASRQFVAAAETVDQNIGRDGLNGDLTVLRRSEMDRIVLAALEKGDIGAVREIVERFMADLSVGVIEKLAEHPELGDLLHADFFDNEPTRPFEVARGTLGAR